MDKFNMTYTVNLKLENDNLKAKKKKQQEDLKIVYESLIAKDYIAAIEILSEVLKDDTVKSSWDLLPEDKKDLKEGE